MLILWSFSLDDILSLMIMYLIVSLFIWTENLHMHYTTILAFILEQATWESTRRSHTSRAKWWVNSVGFIVRSVSAPILEVVLVKRFFFLFHCRPQSFLQLNIIWTKFMLVFGKKCSQRSPKQRLTLIYIKKLCPD